ncbi:MAG: metallophosphoesterase [Verrucomicrobiota bacterium]|nr:metallophosphoesterase [Verrucomicrobiota bacterium]
MHIVLAVLWLIVVIDAVWWWLVTRWTRKKFPRVVIALFMSGQIVGFLWLIASRWSGSGADRVVPEFVSVALLLWHSLGTALLIILALPLALALLVIRRREGRQSGSANDERALSRREFLGFTAALAPPLFTISLSGIAMAQLQNFRVRRFVLPFANLPLALDGFTIAQVADIHVGRFTSGRVLKKMVATVNDLRSDLVLLAGDLINDALADLDEGISLARQMQGRFGLFNIEGNHDLIENPAEFERRMRASGIPFLLDQTAIVPVNGAPLQLLGLSWTRTHEYRDAAISAAVKNLLRLRQPDAFPVLLAHHPHAFDEAIAQAMPLTLSGHTHGGQLMWNEHVGFGPALFRYWSGRYLRGASQLVVSNGVGNWYPLRVNAPAEILHLTLRRA